MGSASQSLKWVVRGHENDFRSTPHSTEKKTELRVDVWFLLALRLARKDLHDTVAFPCVPLTWSATK